MHHQRSLTGFVIPNCDWQCPRTRRETLQQSRRLSSPLLIHCKLSLACSNYRLMFIVFAVSFSPCTMAYSRGRKHRLNPLSLSFAAPTLIPLILLRIPTPLAHPPLLPNPHFWRIHCPQLHANRSSDIPPLKQSSVYSTLVNCPPGLRTSSTCSHIDRNKNGPHHRQDHSRALSPPSW